MEQTPSPNEPIDSYKNLDTGEMIPGNKLPGLGTLHGNHHGRILETLINQPTGRRCICVEFPPTTTPMHLWFFADEVTLVNWSCPDHDIHDVSS